MALTDENGGGMVMPVTPMGGGYGNEGFGGGGWLWFIIVLFALMGGFGNGFGNNGGGMNQLYPWMNQTETINDGFRDQMINGTVNGIRDAVTAGFAGVTNGFAQAEIAANARQMADMNQAFSLQSTLQNCCCENRAGIADLKYVIATENCADRAASANNTRDIIDAQTKGTQAILDKLCALELDGVKGQLAQAQRDNIGLQNKLNMAALRESQTAQNAFIQQGLNNEVDALYNRLRNCPVPSQPVYGMTPIFTCNGGNVGCGCGNM